VQVVKICANIISAMNPSFRIQMWLKTLINVRVCKHNLHVNHTLTQRIQRKVTTSTVFKSEEQSDGVEL